MTATELTVDAAGVRLTGRSSRPSGEPVGTLVAVHGGTYDSGYYDVGEQSLLASGPRRGYRVVAIDRPGYAGSNAVPADRLSFDGQATILAAAVDRIAAETPGPVVLIGHSIGGMLTLLAAARMQTRPAGVEVSGLGELWQPGLRELWGSMISDDASEVALPPDAHAEVMLGPEATRRPDSAALDAALLRPIPMPELRDVVEWSDRLPSAAAAVTVPVSLTLAEFDQIWQADESGQAALARHFTSSPDVAVGRFPGAGHSIELHANAGDYTAAQLDFADRVRSAAAAR